MHSWFGPGKVNVSVMKGISYTSTAAKGKKIVVGGQR